MLLIMAEAVWREITIYTTTDGLDIVGGYLIGQGINGLVLEDAKDFDEFLAATEIHWDYIEESLVNQKKAVVSNIKFYLPDNIQGVEHLRLIEGGLDNLRELNPGIDLGLLTLETSKINEEDWSTAWKKYYHPVKVGKKLVVVPCWELSEYKEGQADKDEIIVTLDPGMAFGTGTHETTRLCMELLEGCFEGKSPQDTELLDIGTGSGILAVTGLLLGAKAAVGVDIDELAVKVAGENAELNSVSDRLTLYCGDLTEKVGNRQFDIVCANIVADVIIRLSKDVRKFMKPNGVLLVSGIITERADEVLEALQAQGFKVMQKAEENGWAAIKLK